MLFVLDLITRTVSILDPVPVNPAFKDQPLNKYTTRIQTICNFLKCFMGVAYPTWNEDIIEWHRRIANGVQINMDSEVSGYYVLLSMRAWTGERLQTPICTDAYELRKRILMHLLTYKGNQNVHNIPQVLRDYLGLEYVR